MRILHSNQKPSKSVWIIPFALLASCAMGMASAGSANFDFRELLSGYGDPGYPNVMRDRVRNELAGREQELWEFIKTSYREPLGLFGVSAGIRALVDLDGFNAAILEEYLEILELVSNRVDNMNDLMGQGGAIIGVDQEEADDEYRLMLNALSMIRSAFHVFETYDDGLPRNLAVRFLELDDKFVQSKVAGWFRAHGTDADIPMLEERATELDSQGATINSGLFREGIREIRFRASAGMPGQLAPGDDASDRGALPDRALPLSSPDSLGKRPQTGLIAWYHILGVAILLTAFVVLFLVLRRLKS